MKTTQPLLKAACLLVLFLFIHKMPALAQERQVKEKQRVIIVKEKTDAKGNTTLNRVEQEVGSDAEAQQLIDKVLGDKDSKSSPDGNNDQTSIRIEKKITDPMDTQIRITDDGIFINGEKMDQDDLNEQLKSLETMPFFKEGMQNFTFDFGDGSAAKGGKAYLGLGTAADGTNQGVEITQVSPGSAAAKAGLKEGDILMTLNDKLILSFDDLVSEVAKGKQGEEVEIKYQRAGKSYTTSAKLGSKPDSSNDRNGMKFEINPENLGDLFSQFGGGAYGFNMPDAKGPKSPRLGVTIEAYHNGRTEGVLVKDVAKGSVAEIMDVRPGDIITHFNQKEVEDVAAVQACVKELRGGDAINLKLKRNKKKVKVSGVWPSDEKEKKRKNVSSF
ncbi:MAG: PDZ domain-containing protein [Saprospiraceae bacterium]